MELKFTPPIKDTTFTFSDQQLTPTLGTSLRELKYFTLLILAKSFLDFSCSPDKELWSLGPGLEALVLQFLELSVRQVNFLLLSSMLRERIKQELILVPLDLLALLL